MSLVDRFPAVAVRGAVSGLAERRYRVGAREGGTGEYVQGWWWVPWVGTLAWPSCTDTGLAWPSYTDTGLAWP